MQLIKSPNPWLEKKVKPFDFDNLDAKKIAEDMIITMKQHGGIGLSANQVGLDAQIFVMEPKDLEGYKDGESFAVINPRIEAVSEQTVLGEEGCLSFPGLFFKVTRAEALVAKFIDSNGKECKIEFKGWNARIFQHEFDHLYGINYIDRVSKMKLDMAKKKQQKYFKKIKGMITYG